MILSSLLYAGVGYVVGAFTPSVGRTIKSFFVKESKVAIAAAPAAVQTAVATATADVKKL